MKKNSLIYIVIALILVFLGLVGYTTWKNRTLLSVTITSKTPEKTDEIKIDKVTQFQVPILMYHYIRVADANDKLGQGLSVTPDNFDAQIKGLVDDNYVSIKMDDLADPNLSAISKIINEKKKPIAITFDDGYADAYTSALPILQKYQMTATFYIIRDYVGRPEYMNQSQIDILASDGMEIGSHTLSHPDLATLSDTNQRTQIFNSKDSTNSFCYPSGKFNDTTISLVKEAGYTTATTTKIGIANETSNLLKLPRVRVENGTAQTLLDKISYAFEHGQN